MSQRGDDRKREREGGESSHEGKRPKAEESGVEDAKLAELRKKRQAKLKALQEEQARNEQASPPARHSAGRRSSHRPLVSTAAPLLQLEPPSLAEL